MNTKELGNTGIKLPEIGFGTYNYRGGIEPLRKAIDLGAIFVDTAEIYGTEATVGEAISSCRSRVFLATKVAPRHFRYRDVLAAADASLRHLRTDYIDLYQLHWPNHTVPIEETMSAMENLVDQGKVRFIGVSRFSPGDLKKAQAALSKHPIVSNQVRYSLIDRSAETETLGYCRAHGISLLAFSPLEGIRHSVSPMDPGQVVTAVARATGKTRAQVALNWCASKDRVIALTTASSIDHVVENWGAAGWRLSPEQSHLLDSEIKFRRQGRVKLALRGLARHALQRLGRGLS